MQMYDAYGPDASYRGNVVPTSVSERVKMIRDQLNIRKGLSLSDSVDKALRELGLPEYTSLNLVQKVDICLESLGLMKTPLSNDQRGYGGGYERDGPYGYDDRYERYERPP